MQLVDHWNFRAAKKATETVWGKTPDYTREGGTPGLLSRSLAHRSRLTRIAFPATRTGSIPSQSRLFDRVLGLQRLLTFITSPVTLTFAEALKKNVMLLPSEFCHRANLDDFALTWFLRRSGPVRGSHLLTSLALLAATFLLTSFSCIPSFTLYKAVTTAHTR